MTRNRGRMSYSVHGTTRWVRHGHCLWTKRSRTAIRVRQEHPQQRRLKRLLFAATSLWTGSSSRATAAMAHRDHTRCD